MTREKWKYTWTEVDLTNGLVGDPGNPGRETINERGARGWELVSVVPSEEQGGSRRYIAFFKRRVEED